MLYKYQFIKHQKLRELNFHFLYFIRKIKDVKKTTKFKPEIFFHSSFIRNNKIAPKGKENSTLEVKFKAFFDIFKKLSQDEKNEFLNLIILSQKIHLFFEKPNNTEAIVLHSSNIKRLLNGSNSFSDLMDALWNYLKSPNAWEIDKHYKIFYDSIPDSKMCPFCGLEELSKPIFRRADYDHIANKSKYPISSIINKNLAPTCDKCNKDFKKAKDVLFDKIGNKRIFSYPFVFNSPFINSNISFDFLGSIHPETDLNNKSGKWVVNISPNSDFILSWDHIYQIKKRYANSINYKKWQKELIYSAKLKHSILTQKLLKEYIKNYKQTFNPSSLEVEYHIKFAYYEFLEQGMNNVLFNQLNTMTT
ncbi:hypothetical protein RB619_12220 [Flavobacterium sp. LHD-80]|uniref:hypothetical protein n=1 Tax=Flavobacterium sp. LHD-80 TaxID=3071411 RepID=UPI0027E0296D|nr:hypothetical protein [Flavobacterium sp. LHD-80]MDQ6471412.1 hypothetical protein [Flavobacterium sp. LHD-80]